MDSLVIRAWNIEDSRYLQIAELAKEKRLGRILLDPTDEGYILERYTELHDKNAYPIYEGDILFSEYDNRHYFVGYDIFNGFVAVRNNGEEEPLRDNYRSCIVVGNLNEDDIDLLERTIFLDMLDSLTEGDFH